MSHQNLIDQVKEIVAESTGLEVEEINMGDHLEEDLMLNLSIEVPKIITRVAQALDIEITTGQIADFMNLLEDEPERAVFSELINFLTEEAEF
jgi:acyl carrier protein